MSGGSPASAPSRASPPMPPLYHKLAVRQPAAAASWRRHVLVRKIKVLAPEVRGLFSSLRARYEEKGESIMSIAASVGYPPYLLCRIFIEELMQVPKSKVSEYVKNPELLGDSRLRREMEACIMADQDFSPYIDRMANSLGKHYEVHLERLLRRLGLPFETEEDLRERGLPRTPDIHLLVPVGVTDQEGKGHVVSWIDSKAMFGDRETVLSDVSLQVTSYVNRFGPGMVIFWLGVEGPVPCPSKDVLVVDRFPEQVLLPDGRVVDTCQAATSS